MAIQVSEQVENQAELKGALSTRSKLAVDSKKFTSQVISLGSAIAISQDTDQFVSEIRQLASDRLASLSFPTTKDEEWKYTDVSSLGNLTFAKNLVVENPIQLLFVSAPQAGATLITQPRCLVIAESHSNLTFIQTFVGIDSQTYFTNTVTEVWLAEGAEVNHTKVQWQGDEAVHINTTAIAQARNSVYKNQSISIGAKISRQNLIVHQMAEQTQTSLTGLAFVDGEQLADTHSVIAHNYPHGSSKQLHKCIADGRSHTVFNGKIQVAKLAQQTDSAQLSRNLLLSPKARVDTKPQLEIFADNVKCAHGATVSQLDAEEIFYLQSRAIDAESAANLLTYAFATEAINQISIVSVQRSLSNFVLEKTKG